MSILFNERRLARRIEFKVPMTVRVWKSVSPEQKVECMNVSERGVYFASGTRFEQGEQLELVIKMPKEIVGQPKTNWRCTSRVVRAGAFDFTSWSLGIAVEFENYHVMYTLPITRVRKITA